MAVIQLIQCKNQQKTSSNPQNIVPYKESGLGNRMVMSDFNWKFVKAVSVHAQ